jgi:hypothetical protein
MSNDERELLKKIKDMIEVLTKVKISEILEKELDEPNKKKLYELTGKATQTQLVKQTGFSAGKISGLWQKWERKGILKKDGKSYKKIFEN